MSQIFLALGVRVAVFFYGWQSKWFIPRILTSQCLTRRSHPIKRLTTVFRNFSQHEQTFTESFSTGACQLFLLLTIVSSQTEVFWDFILSLPMIPFNHRKRHFPRKLQTGNRFSISPRIPCCWTGRAFPAFNTCSQNPRKRKRKWRHRGESPLQETGHSLTVGMSLWHNSSFFLHSLSCGHTPFHFFSLYCWSLYMQKVLYVTLA